MSWIIAGIDPSLTATGICIYSLGRPIFVDTLTSKLKGLFRVIDIKDQIIKILKEHKAIISFIEGYGFGCRGAAIFSLAELGGVIRENLLYNNIGYYDIPPMTLKKFVTGKGNANKNVMLEQVFRRFGIGSEKLVDDNQVDAYSLARFGEKYLSWVTNPEFELTKYEKESFQKVPPCQRQSKTP